MPEDKKPTHAAVPIETLTTIRQLLGRMEHDQVRNLVDAVEQCQGFVFDQAVEKGGEIKSIKGGKG